MRRGVAVRGRRVVGPVIVAGLVLVGCGGQSEREELADRLESQFGMKAEQADCVANQVYERFTEEQIDALREAETRSELSEDLSRDLYVALAPCASAGS